MFKDTKAFSGFSTNDIDAAAGFYGGVLGLEFEKIPEGLMLKFAGSNGIFVYPKENHEPASYTILNFPVDDIDTAVDELRAKGVTFEQYPEMTDEKGIARGLAVGMGPNIAWFKDPAGNVLAILQQA